jgi:CRP-like cAMP-binding protein
MSNEAKRSFIDLFPFFAGLNDDEKQQLADYFEMQERPRYSSIFKPGDSSNTIYFLARGVVKTGTHSNDGKEVIKALIHPLAMFGELGLVGETERHEFAQTLKDNVVLYAISVENFKKMMRTNFDLCSRMMNYFGNRLANAENKLESLIFKDARTRIVEFIRETVNTRGQRVGYEMLLRHSLTHQDIANITCTSRQTVTLVLNDLRKSDLIYFNRGKILVRDMAKLA